MGHHTASKEFIAAVRQRTQAEASFNRALQPYRKPAAVGRRPVPSLLQAPDQLTRSARESLLAAFDAVVGVGSIRGNEAWRMISHLSADTAMQARNWLSTRDDRQWHALPVSDALQYIIERASERR